MIRLALSSSAKFAIDSARVVMHEVFTGDSQLCACWIGKEVPSIRRAPSSVSAPAAAAAAVGTKLNDARAPRGTGEQSRRR